VFNEHAEDYTLTMKFESCLNDRYITTKQKNTNEELIEGVYNMIRCLRHDEDIKPRDKMVMNLENGCISVTRKQWHLFDVEFNKFIYYLPETEEWELRIPVPVEVENMD
jgi:hypothetical protein